MKPPGCLLNSPGPTICCFLFRPYSFHDGLWLRRRPLPPQHARKCRHAPWHAIAIGWTHSGGSRRSVCLDGSISGQRRRVEMIASAIVRGVEVSNAMRRPARSGQAGGRRGNSARNEQLRYLEMQRAATEATRTVMVLSPDSGVDRRVVRSGRGHLADARRLFPFILNLKIRLLDQAGIHVKSQHAIDVLLPVGGSVQPLKMGQHVIVKRQETVDFGTGGRAACENSGGRAYRPGGLGPC